MSPYSSAESSPRTRIRRALVSVYDKSGLTELATALAEAGVEIVSTGSTAATIAAAGIKVTPVETVTGFPECLDGRVKTLHPRIHAGILANRSMSSHQSQLDELNIAAFDLVVVNLYPFTATVASDATIPEIIEHIDVGGPTMIRAAAKNHDHVAVIVDPGAYHEVYQAIRDGGFHAADRQRLAAVAFAHTATYDVAIANWMHDVLVPHEGDPSIRATVDSGFAHWTGFTFERAAVLRYGENPHQSAVLYQAHDGAPGLASGRLLQGKEMSFNNYVDADAAWRAAYDHQDPAVAIMKHANPCGIATADTVEEAYRRAHATDPVSAFGGVIAANRSITGKMASEIVGVFTEVIVAPGFEPEALDIFTLKKNLRLLVVDSPPISEAEWRPVSGGLLVQSTDRVDAVGDHPASWTLVAGAPASPDTLADLEFAWRAVRAAKSNAILLAHDRAAVGIGMGQVNRVDACGLAVQRANAGPDGQERARGSVAASDAFFPFADGLQVLIDAGVAAVVQPGGSVRDAEVIAAAQAAGLTMYVTGTRHFAH